MARGTGSGHWINNQVGGIRESPPSRNNISGGGVGAISSEGGCFQGRGRDAIDIKGAGFVTQGAALDVSRESHFTPVEGVKDTAAVTGKLEFLALDAVANGRGMNTVDHILEIIGRLRLINITTGPSVTADVRVVAKNTDNGRGWVGIGTDISATAMTFEVFVTIGTLGRINNLASLGIAGHCLDRSYGMTTKAIAHLSEIGLQGDGPHSGPSRED